MTDRLLARCLLVDRLQRQRHLDELALQTDPSTRPRVRSRPAPSNRYQRSPTEPATTRVAPIEQRPRRDPPHTPGPHAPRSGPLATQVQRDGRRSPDLDRCCDGASRPTRRHCSAGLSCARSIRARSNRPRTRPRDSPQKRGRTSSSATLGSARRLGTGALGRGAIAEAATRPQYPWFAAWPCAAPYWNRWQARLRA